MIGALALAGCGGMQSALAPSGAGADAIYRLWWVFLYVCAAVFALVIAGLAAALLRRRQPTAAAAVPHPDRDTPGERRLTHLLNAATAITAAILVALTLATYGVGAALFATTDAPADIEVVGHRWWWEVRYPAGADGPKITSANEIHIPTGTPVRIALQSEDVIHSLWVPNLHGKMDLIPGQTNRIVLDADRPGVFRGQCAEFCGLQHAFMALYVIAAAPEDYRRWLRNERRPGADPVTDAERRGRQVFVDKCAVCHPIRGLREEGKGPDLTHIAGRLALGAGRLPNSRGNRGGWIADAPDLKPGVTMPNMTLPPDDLQALLLYLDRLE